MASTDDGRASRSKPDFSSLTHGQSAMSYALEGLTNRPPEGSEGSWTPEDGSALVETDNGELLEGYNGSSGNTAANVSKSDGANMSQPSKRRRSIQVVIEESKKGRYIISADDPEFREIMRSSIERETAKNGKSGKNSARIRDLVFTRQFTTFDRQNPRAAQSPFHGFFTLFWLAMALLLLKIAAQNWRYQGSVFGNSEILHLMVDRDLFVMLSTDALMCVCTAFGFLLQKAIAAGYLTWDGSGWIIQSVWQLWFTVNFIWICFYREWPWTHTVFIVLHDLVLLMKQHAYTFYNGYLSRVHRRRKLLEEKLKQLEDLSVQPSPSTTSPGAQALSTSAVDRLHRSNSTSQRSPKGPKYSTNLSSENSDIATMAQIIESREPLDADQIQAFTRILATEITILSDELRGKSTCASNAYPKNLTLANFIDWTCLPTLVYDLEYPRQSHINWWYVAEKSAATVGVIWIMIIISQAYIYPVVVQTVQAKESGMTLDERWKEFPWVVSDMLFPMLLEQLLSWYVIWECVLNVLAEVTRFADRGFYGDWWNSVSWDQYARDWNRPVHNFLLRHVYHSSISAFRLSKTAATFMTFLLSAIVHELLMFCLFKKVRGYLFALQLSQVPLAAMSRTRLMKGRDTLGNIIFWFGLFIGPSLITSLYLIV